MPPRKKAASAPDDLADKTPANGADLDALRDEVAAEPGTQPAADDDTWPRPIPLGDVTVRVKHYLDWPLDIDKHLAVIDIAGWAADAIAGDDFEKVWKAARPTLRQGLKFVKDVEVAVGVPFAPHLASLTN